MRMLEAVVRPLDEEAAAATSSASASAQVRRRRASRGPTPSSSSSSSLQRGGGNNTTAAAAGAAAAAPAFAGRDSAAWRNTTAGGDTSATSTAARRPDDSVRRFRVAEALTTLLGKRWGRSPSELLEPRASSSSTSASPFDLTTAMTEQEEEEAPMHVNGSNSHDEGGDRAGTDGNDDTSNSAAATHLRDDDYGDPVASLDGRVYDLLLRSIDDDAAAGAVAADNSVDAAWLSGDQEELPEGAYSSTPGNATPAPVVQPAVTLADDQVIGGGGGGYSTSTSGGVGYYAYPPSFFYGSTGAPQSTLERLLRFLAAAQIVGNQTLPGTSRQAAAAAAAAVPPFRALRGDVVPRSVRVADAAAGSLTPAVLTSILRDVREEDVQLWWPRMHDLMSSYAGSDGR